MTPVSDTVLDTLHDSATHIFTGSIEACNIASAFDRRIRFEGSRMHRLMPDGSGPATIDLSNYRRVFVIALGKAAGPMLETLLDRMKRRKGLRGLLHKSATEETELAVPLFRGRAPAAQ
jgi:hydroxypyruvate reductase